MHVLLIFQRNPSEQVYKIFLRDFEIFLLKKSISTNVNKISLYDSYLIFSSKNKFYILYLSFSYMWNMAYGRPPIILLI